ncbi:phosphatidate cytidylyltransferase [Ideonella alba]|uniref:Phosphatidate cytidylyltransferase n=1 Tax=Ideonella alba TaxID=2824118 RepID=A0A940Y752_9BURK|nr:phosphatidate cytidylyltransferase [Ideonella alba]MBQ0931102.1 phosphatidate cytidylyltransferase [Ideonella alba]
MGWLRSLSVEQQVGLLFVVLFGVLALCSAGALLWNLREPGSDRERRARERFARDLRAVWFGAVLFWLGWLSGAVGATLLFGVLAFLALREFVTLMHTRRSDHRALLAAFFVILPLQFVLAGGRWFNLFSVFIPVYAFIALPVISALAGDPERFLERNAKLQWGLMVCAFGLSHVPALLLLEFRGYGGRGAFLLFFLVVVAALAQIAQELASHWLRRRPAVRAISRSFSWRAWVAGVLAGAVAGAALYWITPFKPWQAFAMAALAGGAGQMGELVMKALKKDAGVQYWGPQASVTGAVGLLDRIAPLAFSAPVFFHSLRWYFSLP